MAIPHKIRGFEIERKNQMSKIDTLYIEVCVFKRYRGKIYYLILKRSESNKIFPGIPQIVTGTMRKTYRGGNSENAVKAAIREVFEETGLFPKRLWVLPVINSYYMHTIDTVNLSPIFAAEVDFNSQVRISDEHQSYEWMTYKQAVKKLLWQSHKSALRYLNNYLTGKENWGKFLEIKKDNWMLKK